VTGVENYNYREFVFITATSRAGLPHTKPAYTGTFHVDFGVKETLCTFELFEAVTEVTMHIQVLRDLTPYSLVYNFQRC
jgi:hypothetical protein